jgi:conjugal transfer pilus assembly protein TraW
MEGWRSFATAALAVAISLSGPAQAQGEGSKAEQAGPVYPIAEPDMLEEIERKLKDMQDSGRMQQKIDEAIERSKRSAQYPRKVDGLGTVKKARTYYFDPSVVAARDVKDHQGKVIVKAGTKVNPLDYIGMGEWLVFFDGTSEAQVKLAEELGKKYEWMIKPILVNGGPMDIMRRWKKRVYFDQGGSMVKRLGIENVPALVTQDGKRLRIDELEQ